MMRKLVYKKRQPVATYGPCLDTNWNFRENYENIDGILDYIDYYFRCDHGLLEMFFKYFLEIYS